MATFRVLYWIIITVVFILYSILKLDEAKLILTTLYCIYTVE